MSEHEHRDVGSGTHVPSDATIPLVSVDELAGRDQRTTTVIDVRTVPEFAEGHVPGAQLLPLHVLVEDRTEVVTAGAVYVVCGSGTRSAMAVAHLRTRGVDARAVAGGARAWTEAGHVLER